MNRVPADKWYRSQATAERAFPAFLRGDIFVSIRHGNLISGLIAFFQGKGTPPAWSHTGVYVGNGQVAEATTPKGGVHNFGHYFGKGYTMALYRLPLTEEQRASMSSEATRLAPRKYDYPKIAMHLIDNLIERLTWNESTQTGKRPLSHFFPDPDGDRANVCSELVERAAAYAGVPKMQEGKLGEARPKDVYTYCRSRGMLVYYHEQGVPYDQVRDPNWGGVD